MPSVIAGDGDIVTVAATVGDEGGVAVNGGTIVAVEEGIGEDAITVALATGEQATIIRQDTIKKNMYFMLSPISVLRYQLFRRYVSKKGG
ncbi:MAG: hypothetical protein UX62_C0033G0005 [Microgenomates group bacterium GW2011_GWA2_46_7]|nr:MAG: hypothetical protein UX62_C0033G0005 [Microgenomates group bacterium GW2011_GWA2_46_7]